MTIGYKEIYYPTHPKAKANGCILEQRYVAEQILGRILNDDEVVHHKDENRNNNDVSNLMVFKTQQDHARYHSGQYDKIICNNNVYECIPLKKKCIVCGKIFTKNKNKKYCCMDCKRFGERKVQKRPSKEELLKLLETNSYFAIGRMYGVSDNTIRKWLK